ncbi:MAG: disulfide bond formation protein B [Chloroflexi bacterium]|nr:disulfide bond formation protein B [Chloroflexota bacterium]
MNETLTELLNKVFSVLSIISIALSILIIFVYLLKKSENNLIKSIRNLISEYNVLFAWTIASLASIGSLFYSEISGFVPCTFCWYERIAMYPLVLVLGVGIFLKSKESWIFGFPLSAIGLIITIYHYQLQMFPDQNSISCSTDVSCTGTWIMEFGFVTMPFMALSTFLLISVLLLIPNIKLKK